MKHTHRELLELLKEYVTNPYNHENCDILSRPDTQIPTVCQCGLYDTIDQFLEWVKQRDNDIIK